MAGRKVFSEQEVHRCLGEDPRPARAVAQRLAGEPRAAVRAPAVSAPARYVLHVGGVDLEVGDDFQEATLRRLVGLLKSC